MHCFLQPFAGAPRTVAAIVVLVLLALLPFIAGSIGSDYYVGFGTRVLIYALAAIGLNFILGFGGMVSLGHAMYVMLGAYAVAIPSTHGIVSGWLHLAVAVAATAVLAAGVGAVALRTSGIAFIMITLAFAQMLYFGAVGLKDYGGDDGLTVAERSIAGLYDLSNPTTLYYVALVTVLLALYLSWRAVLSPFGLVLRATKANKTRNCARASSVSLPADCLRHLCRSLRGGWRVAGQSDQICLAFVWRVDAVGRADRYRYPWRHRNGVRPGGRRHHPAGAGRTAAQPGGNGDTRPKQTGCFSSGCSSLSSHSCSNVVSLARSPTSASIAVGKDERRIEGTAMSALVTQSLVKRFGGVLATDHVSLTVEPGEIHAIIGPNGAGKSTLIGQLAGEIASDEGHVLMFDEDVTQVRTHQRAQRSRTNLSGHAARQGIHCARQRAAGSQRPRATQLPLLAQRTR